MDQVTFFHEIEPHRLFLLSINARRIPGVPYLPPGPDPDLFKK